MKKILITSPDSMLRFFLLPHVDLLLQQGYKVDIVCSKVDESEDQIKELLHNCVNLYKVDIARKPGVGSIGGISQLKPIIDNGHYDLIWTHGPVMGVVTRLAAQSARKHGTKVVYMSHGFFFCKGTTVMNWIKYFPVEWLCSFLTDMLITINREDYALAKKFLHTKMVQYTPGVGVDLKRFRPFRRNRFQMRKSMGMNSNDFVIFSVGFSGEVKDYLLVIQALGIILSKKAFSCIQYLICASGEREDKLRNIARENGIEEHVHFIECMQDISDLYNCSDVFVSPSKEEGSSAAIAEAMACGVPVIYSKTKENVELVEDGINGICCEDSADSYVEAFIRMMNSESFRMRCAALARERINTFDLDAVKIYMQKVHNRFSAENSQLGRIILRQEIRKKYGIALGRLVIMSAGEITERKNHAVIIRALGKLKDISVCLVICGEGPMKERHLKLAKKLGVEDRVFFIGFQKEIQRIYCMGDIFVFPSHLEGLGLAAIEAMTAGMPLISSNVHGINDYSLDNETGFKCKPDDANAFAYSIRKLAQDRVLREKIRHHNMEATEKYDINKVKPLINAMMNEILSRQT